MIKISNTGKFEKTHSFLERVKNPSQAIRRSQITRIAEDGVKALSLATPVDTGVTAASWSYEIEEKNGKTIIHWLNSNVNDNVNIAIILQYGHGTRTGGYVQGRDYINPAIQPIFDRMSAEFWEVMTK